MNFWDKTPLRRAFTVITAPAWFPLLIVFVVVGTSLFWAIGILWCQPVRLVSWVLYNNDYVLGRWWWPMDMCASTDDHRSRTQQALACHEERQGRPPRVF